MNAKGEPSSRGEENVLYIHSQLKRIVNEERLRARGQGQEWTGLRKFLHPIESHGVQHCAVADCRRKSAFVTYRTQEGVRVVLCIKHAGKVAKSQGAEIKADAAKLEKIGEPVEVKIEGTP